MEHGVVRTRPKLVFPVESAHHQVIIQTRQAKLQVSAFKHVPSQLLNELLSTVNHLTSQLAYKLNAANVT